MLTRQQRPISLVSSFVSKPLATAPNTMASSPSDSGLLPPPPLLGSQYKGQNTTSIDTTYVVTPQKTRHRLSTEVGTSTEKLFTDPQAQLLPHISTSIPSSIVQNRSVQDLLSDWLVGTKNTLSFNEIMQTSQVHQTQSAMNSPSVKTSSSQVPDMSFSSSMKATSQNTMKGSTDSVRLIKSDASRFALKQQQESAANHTSQLPQSIFATNRPNDYLGIQPLRNKPESKPLKFPLIPVETIPDLITSSNPVKNKPFVSKWFSSQGIATPPTPAVAATTPSVALSFNTPSSMVQSATEQLKTESNSLPTPTVFSSPSLGIPQPIGGGNKGTQPNKYVLKHNIQIIPKLVIQSPKGNVQQQQQQQAQQKDKIVLSDSQLKEDSDISSTVSTQTSITKQLILSPKLRKFKVHQSPEFDFNEKHRSTSSIGSILLSPGSQNCFSQISTPIESQQESKQDQLSDSHSNEDIKPTTYLTTDHPFEQLQQQQFQYPVATAIFTRLPTEESEKIIIGQQQLPQQQLQQQQHRKLVKNRGHLLSDVLNSASKNMLEVIPVIEEKIPIEHIQKRFSYLKGAEGSPKGILKTKSVDMKSKYYTNQQQQQTQHRPSFSKDLISSRLILESMTKGGEARSSKGMSRVNYHAKSNSDVGMFQKQKQQGSAIGFSKKAVNFRDTLQIIDID